MCPLLNIFKLNLSKALAEATIRTSTIVNASKKGDLQVWLISSTAKKNGSPSIMKI
jgi:hypothetical protein